jgi:CBS-domain-containing membrane protein
MELATWLNKVTASEIMVESVVTLSPDDSLATAAETLLRKQISGAPVVDAGGRCVGVLAFGDLLRAEGKPSKQRQPNTRSTFFDFGMALPSSVDAQRLEQFRDKVLSVSEHSVGEFMTTDLVRVRSDAPLSTVVSYLIDAHLHRVLVLDEDQRLKGIVSTIDVLAALQRASR